ncbi:MAG: hypothetical protein DI598_15245 [Pseudopedobacter saltans]|uniref:Cytochrome c domain-containing protein n=1 Tax=Pseudopedobacter saltans TaxID=151895 RepID=A0A2W5GDZ2_9SPHI|nr:MAG: hypothetical protein DI598_15245 [Pseudopedobacter saltans]
MKKKYLAIGLMTILIGSVACNNPNSNARPSEKNKTTTTTDLIDNAGLNIPEEYREGAQLVTSNDCLTCHKVSDTSIGPSFTSIANRYDNIEANESKLLVSVQQGSHGIWGTKVMTPHPNLTPEDGHKMIRYILSNRTKK